MQHRFLSDGSDFRSYGGGNFSKAPKSSGMFWWAVLITLMMGMVIFCWFFSIMVFSHPEKPFNYRLLARLDKLDAIRPFSIYTAPDGPVKSAKDLLTAYYQHTPEQLSVANDVLMRSYIRNYAKKQLPPPVFVTGSFRVLKCDPLKTADVINSGWVVRMRSVDLEDVDVEMLLPNVTGDAAPYSPGAQLKLDGKRSTFMAVMHVQKLGEDRMCVSTVPLTYQGLIAENGKALAMGPPKVLNMDASLPVTPDPGVDQNVAAVPADR
ncbi:MAG: hypothetical protein H7A55_23860 [Verrucomicrobiaceae bacterium]|nr:hypothetical protein [Verrucomicrobiaceae bacterium]